MQRQCLTARLGTTEIMTDHLGKIKQSWQMPFETDRQGLAAVACIKPAYGLSTLLVSCKPGLRRMLILGCGYSKIQRVIDQNANARISMHPMNTSLHHNTGNGK